jgi:hypothetical protein
VGWSGLRFRGHCEVLCIYMGYPLSSSEAKELDTHPVVILA